MLTDIRRAFHTLKGSGRMVGGLALGDYAWAHENMLNRVLEGLLPRNDNLANLLHDATAFLDQHTAFFLTSTESNADSKAEMDKVEYFVAQPDGAVQEIGSVSDTEPGLVGLGLSGANVMTEVDGAQMSGQADLVDLDFSDTDTSTEQAEPSLVDIDFSDTDSSKETTEHDLVDLDFSDTDSSKETTEHDLVDLDFSAAGNLAEAAEPEPDELMFSPLEGAVPSGSEDNDLLPEVTPEPAQSETMRFNEHEENRIIWEMFREELPEQLQTIDQLMQSLFSNSKDVEARRSLERELHTLKGGARMAQLEEMGEAAHQAEELLSDVGRRRDKDLSPELDLLQAHIDHISVLAEQFSLAELPGKVAAEASGDAEEEQSAPDMSFMVERLEGGQGATYDSYLERLLNEQASQLPPVSVLNGLQNQEKDIAGPDKDEGNPALLGQEQIRLSAVSLDKMIENANALNIQQNTLSERLQAMGDDVGEFGRTASRLKQLLRSLELETEAQIHAGYRQSAPANEQSSDFDPLEMDEYSEIQRLSRALAESLNDLVNIEGDLSTQLRSADRFIKESMNSSRELHHDLLATRLIEVSVVTPRLRRILRQTAAELDRKVTLDIEGEALKLDRHLLQRMTAPIEHLLRNAVSHAIESTEEREQQNKPASGKITLKIYREDTEIVFCIVDDGRGLNSQKIHNKAVSLGLINVGDELSDQEIHRLILRPGFSTAKQVSQIAGRGVGMDVVNSEIKAMGGNLLIESTSGEGTGFTIRLPFAMAANPVLFVDIQDQSYALPLGSVQGLTRMDAETLQNHLGNEDMPLSFNDEAYPVHYLGLALGHQRGLNLNEDSMYAIVYTRTGGYCIAWVVDSVAGRRDVILQSLGALFKSCRFYSAATITSDGRVVMVPDMLDLTERVLTTPDAERVGSEIQVEETAVIRHENPHVMIVDDSITVRKVTEKLLAHENYVLETARDGFEALEKLDDFAPDLLLLDIEMPRMDGFEVLSAVRSNPRWKQLPIIMISSRTAEKHREHAEQLGATDFLGKPYQSQALLEHIRKYLESDGVSGEVEGAVL